MEIFKKDASTTDTGGILLEVWAMGEMKQPFWLYVAVWHLGKHIVAT